MSAAARVAVAVMGVGEFGRNHARVYRELEDVELVGVFDREPAKAHAVAAEFGTDVIGDLNELRGRVAAASVAVPTEAHGETGCRLLEMGIDVLVEKPMAADLKQADALIESAKKTNGFCRLATLND